MSFKIERNDITKVSADAIVNTANPMPTVGAGTDTAIYKAAGYEELIEERTGINTMTAEDPMKVVAIGTGQYVEFMNGKKDF